MSNTHERLEQAEHAAHAVHDPFDKRVALTIAVIAAVLAGVTLLGHRSHNETLQFQIDAGINQSKANDKWSYYQAKRIRMHEYRALDDLLAVMPKEPGKENDAAALTARWAQQSDKYEHDELPKLEKEAREFEKEAGANWDESEYSHHKSTRYDLGEMAVELGLVLCSIAILTKRRPFWFGGIAAAAVGVVIAATVVFVTPQAKGPHEGPATEQHATEKKLPSH